MIRNNQQYEVNLKDDDPKETISPQPLGLADKLKMRKLLLVDSTGELHSSPDELGFHSTSYSPEKELLMLKAEHAHKYSKVPQHGKKEKGRSSEMSNKQDTKAAEYQTNVSSVYGGLSYI